MKIIMDGKVPIKLWVDELEEGALDQAKNLSNLPFVYKHISLMPDCHQGYGMPIGGVLATKNVVIPNAVGVDIGCGMCAIKTGWTVNDIDDSILKKIMDGIRKVIPVGFNKHKENQSKSYMPYGGNIPLDVWFSDEQVIQKEYDNALKSIGTLGGGNHFLEIQKDSKGNIWIMIHSGSRNLGYKVAKKYNDIAKELNELWYTSIDPKWDLAFLPMDTSSAEDYMIEMDYCVKYAFANRKLMMTRVAETFNSIMGEDKIQLDEMINIAHNYARWENHFGKNVIVHRKGATSAKEGEIGIIPGSQGTKSYIVKGKGNVNSFKSCSHGAGRKMSRTQARKELNLEDEIKLLNKRGIIHGIRNEQDLDEAPSAYKDINVVMENQKDLVEIKTELTPIAVIKG